MEVIYKFCNGHEKMDVLGMLILAVMLHQEVIFVFYSGHEPMVALGMNGLAAGQRSRVISLY